MRSDRYGLGCHMHNVSAETPTLTADSSAEAPFVTEGQQNRPWSDWPRTLSRESVGQHSAHPVSRRDTPCLVRGMILPGASLPSLSAGRKAGIPPPSTADNAVHYPLCQPV